MSITFVACHAPAGGHTMTVQGRRCLDVFDALGFAPYPPSSGSVSAHDLATRIRLAWGVTLALTAPGAASVYRLALPQLSVFAHSASAHGCIVSWTIEP